MGEGVPMNSAPGRPSRSSRHWYCLLSISVAAAVDEQKTSIRESDVVWDSHAHNVPPDRPANQRLCIIGNMVILQ